MELELGLRGGWVVYREYLRELVSDTVIKILGGFLLP